MAEEAGSPEFTRSHVTGRRSKPEAVALLNRPTHVTCARPAHDADMRAHPLRTARAQTGAAAQISGDNGSDVTSDGRTKVRNASTN